MQMLRVLGEYRDPYNDCGTAIFFQGLFKWADVRLVEGLLLTWDRWMDGMGAWDSGIVLGIVDGGSGRGAQVHWTFTFNDFRENWVIAFAGAGHRHHGFGGNCRGGGEVQSLHQESVNRLLGPLWGRALASCAVQCGARKLPRDFFRFLFHFFLVDPNCARLSRLIRCIACWWGWWIWSSCEKSGSFGGEAYEEGEKMSAITKIIEKATLIDLYEVLAGQTQSIINSYH